MKMALLIGIAILGLVGTVISIAQLVHFLRSQKKMEFPLQEKTVFEADRQGRMILAIKGPQFFVKPRIRLGLDWLKCRLTSLETGMEIPAKLSWFRMTEGYLTEAEIEIRHFTIPYRGRYQLDIPDITKISHPEELSLVIKESRNLAFALRIVLLVLAANAFVGGTILALQRGKGFSMEQAIEIKNGHVSLDAPFNLEFDFKKVPTPFFKKGLKPYVPVCTGNECSIYLGEFTTRYNAPPPLEKPEWWHSSFLHIKRLDQFFENMEAIRTYYRSFEDYRKGQEWALTEAKIIRNKNGVPIFFPNYSMEGGRESLYILILQSPAILIHEDSDWIDTDSLHLKH